MTEVELDFSLENVSGSFEPLPVGQYMAKIENPDDFALGESSNGKPMIRAVWTIVEGEYEGRKLFDNIVLSVQWKVKQYCEAAGVESGSKLNTDDFVGMEGLVKVTQQEYQGEIRNQVKTVSPTD